MKNHVLANGSTASATLVMAGAGSTIAPVGSGNVFVHVHGVAFTAAAAVPMAIGGRFGTGTPPSAGNAVKGSRFAQDITVLAAGSTGGVGFCLADIVNLIPATTYWFDIVISTTNVSDAATVQNVGIILLEV